MVTAFLVPDGDHSFHFHSIAAYRDHFQKEMCLSRGGGSFSIFAYYVYLCVYVIYIYICIYAERHKYLILYMNNMYVDMSICIYMVMFTQNVHRPGFGKGDIIRNQRRPLKLTILRLGKIRSPRNAIECIAYCLPPQLLPIAYWPLPIPYCIWPKAC